uniref:histidine kinase n=1 Tax=uncultured Alphaproteobacteria bacterium TaxID=91750 RepID=A0A6G8F2P6_9PROT|nr:histidine kinase [uncultured Alphaproteobacteria bacterium]
MFKSRNRIFQIEKDSNFATRILVLSMPASLVFIMLVALRLLPASIAIMAYSSIIIFNIVWLFPITFELQQIKKYIFKLSQENSDNIDNLLLTENETRDIVKAINEMHRFWTNKADTLEAQTISDTAVLDTLPDPILMIDRNGNILGANGSAHKLLGENITEKKVEEIFNSNNFINAVAKVLRQESDAENLIFYVNKEQDADNNKKLYAHIKRLPWISKGRAVAVISIYDLTKAMKIEKMQSDFVANASHELRTPLSIISGFIETLQTTAKDDKEAQKTFLKIMGEQAGYMSVLIENLLSLSRIELNQDQLPEDKVIIEPIIEDAVKALTLKAQERNITFETTSAKNIPPVTADYAQVRQLLQNLCDNAIKYGEENSQIKISTTVCQKIPTSKSYQVADGPAVVIAVNNQGTPIGNDEIGRLTERFYRLQTHKDKNIKGTGLGLAIAKHILIRHRGNMRVSSSQKHGTTFTIYLPVEQSPNYPSTSGQG